MKLSMKLFFNSQKGKASLQTLLGNPWLQAVAAYLLLLAAASVSGFDAEIYRAYHAEHHRLGGLVSTRCVSWFERLAIKWHAELMPATIAIVFFGTGLRMKRTLLPVAAVAGGFMAFWSIQLLLLSEGSCDWNFQSRSLWICWAAGAASAAISVGRPSAKWLASPRAAAVAALACAVAGTLLWVSNFDWHKFDPYSIHIFTPNEYKMMECASVAASMALGLAVGFARGGLRGRALRFGQLQRPG